MKFLTRSQLAKEVDINPETIRYYERLGLLPKALRSTNGYRLFSEEDVRRIKFIKRMKKLGFTLKEIKELLELRFKTEAECFEVKHIVEKKLKDVEEKIKDLENIKKILQELIRQCPSKGFISNCPIISSIEK